MKLNKSVLLASAVTAAVMMVPNAAFAQTCKVTDPTGTPLNLRTSPNGKIIRKVKNFTPVHIMEYAYDNKGRPWAYISFRQNGNTYYGYVFREFVSCY
ncbi:SH3 domain-containing protein [Moraxella pluranimalium]|uniref:SH3b domain-containing protein n=1 Tax=Moraxella pluranimalium TaxID=470453 RepID=A0A1T0CTS7_9GAMM|nr:SH3 domain-containing protein [Moraxella pluranimalium]OOS25754.1 hypothetical protein B0680_02765 [Moraxella pluranimalium]